VEVDNFDKFIHCIIHANLSPFGLTEYHGSDGTFIIAEYGFVTFFVLSVDLFVKLIFQKRSKLKYVS